MNVVITLDNNMKKLTYEKKIEDRRGKILFLSYGNNKINLIEIRKSFARGGHFHKSTTSHFLIKGKIELHEENINTKQEKISIIEAPFILVVPSNHAHLLIALEDSLFFESFGEYEATNFPKYRNIIDKKLNQK